MIDTDVNRPKKMCVPEVRARKKRRSHIDLYISVYVLRLVSVIGRTNRERIKYEITSWNAKLEFYWLTFGEFIKNRFQRFS